MKHIKCPCCGTSSLFVERKNETIKYFIDVIYIDVIGYCPTCDTDFTKTCKYELTDSQRDFSPQRIYNNNR